MEKKKIVIITPQSQVLIQSIEGEFVDYDTLNNGVQGWIESVSLMNGLTMWVNEEGKLLGLDVNPIATRLWEKMYGPTDIIVGPAVLTAGTDEDGETLAFNEQDAYSLLAMIDSLN